MRGRRAKAIRRVEAQLREHRRAKAGTRASAIAETNAALRALRAGAPIGPILEPLGLGFRR